MAVTASKALTELRRLFREYDSGKMSESEYVASAKRLEELVETAYDAGRISEKTYFAFTEEYGVNIQYVTGI